LDFLGNKQYLCHHCEADAINGKIDGLENELSRETLSRDGRSLIHGRM
jgi:hypothetical protein